jgi:hypothetical protein
MRIHTRSCDPAIRRCWQFLGGTDVVTGRYEAKARLLSFSLSLFLSFSLSFLLTLFLSGFPLRNKHVMKLAILQTGIQKRRCRSSIIHLSIHPSIYPSIYLSIYLSVYLSIHPSIIIVSSPSLLCSQRVHSLINEVGMCFQTRTCVRLRAGLLKVSCTLAVMMVKSSSGA